jgi:hypothetical protein
MNRYASCPAKLDSCGWTSSRRVRLWRLSPHLVGGEVLDGSAEEHVPDHRSPLSHDAIDRPEAIEPRGQQGLDRGRDRDRADLADQDPATTLVSRKDPVVEEHRQHLLDEERIPLGRLDDLVPDVRVEVRLAQQVGGDLGTLILRERREHEHAVLVGSLLPVRMEVEEVGPRRARDHDRGAGER